MRPDLQNRFLKVAKNLDRLERLKNLVGDIEQTSPRSLVASAAIASAEFLASAMGMPDDVATIHRAYEEVFAALENSEAVNEILSVKTASADKCITAVSHLHRFRRSLLGGNNA